MTGVLAANVASRLQYCREIAAFLESSSDSVNILYRGTLTVTMEKVNPNPSWWKGVLRSVSFVAAGLRFAYAIVVAVVLLYSADGSDSAIRYGLVPSPDQNKFSMVISVLYWLNYGRFLLVFAMQRMHNERIRRFEERVVQVPGLVNDKKNLLTYLLSDLINVNSLIAALILVGIKGSIADSSVIYTIVMQCINVALAYMVPPHTVFGPMRKLDSTGIVIHPSLFAYDFVYCPSGMIDYLKVGFVDFLLNWRNYYFWLWYWVTIFLLLLAYTLAFIVLELSKIPILGFIGRVIYCFAIEIGVRLMLCGLDCLTCNSFYLDVLFVIQSTLWRTHPLEGLLLYPEIDLFAWEGAFGELQVEIERARTQTVTQESRRAHEPMDRNELGQVLLTDQV